MADIPGLKLSRAEYWGTSGETKYHCSLPQEPRTQFSAFPASLTVFVYQ